MMSNTGKQFEKDFTSSIPDWFLLQRLYDPVDAFYTETKKYAKKQPCDYIGFNPIKRIFCAFELKSTKSSSIGFDDIYSNKVQNHMIPKHQILSLKKYSEYDSVLAGFFFNFRHEKQDIEMTYFQRISDFLNMCKIIKKQSFNEVDLLTTGKAIKIQGEKKRVHYKWNIENFLKEVEIENNASYSF